ncbi:hypothetical protein KAR91_59875 [Candidatus Pacearchaeota archaeon]|nr:hypothetical protein [Candidatus Pacearchaeota archaeon]
MDDDLLKEVRNDVRALRKDLKIFTEKCAVCRTEISFMKKGWLFVITACSGVFIWLIKKGIS